MYKRLPEPEPKYDPQMELIQIKRETYQRLKEHGRYYNFDEEGNSNSVDEIITKLIDFYEHNYLFQK